MVADLGCGNGKLASACAGAGHAALGCDFSAELVRIANGEKPKFSDVFHMATIQAEHERESAAASFDESEQRRKFHKQMEKLLVPSTQRA